MYYLQVYGFYEEIEATNVADVQMTGIVTGMPQTILYENFQAIDAESSPLRYRACFETSHSQAMLTETFELYDDPIPTVAPGWFDSPLAESWKSNPKREDAILSHTAQRRWGTATDLAGAYRFLASDASAFITGSVLSVDGGYLLV